MVSRSGCIRHNRYTLSLTSVLAAALVLLCALPAPAVASTATITNGILSVVYRDDALGRGLFVVRTGASHPTPNRNVFWTDAGATNIGTSYLTIRDVNSAIMWVNADAVAPSDPGLAGYTVAKMSSYPSVISGGGTAMSVTYSLPGFTVIQAVSISGTILENSAVRQSVTIQNTSGVDKQVGARFLWDWMVNDADAAYFRERHIPDTGLQYTRTFTAYSAPDFWGYEETDSPVVPTFSIFGTCKGGSLTIPPTTPDELRFSPWGNAKDKAWDYTNDAGWQDSAIVYFWGLDTPEDLPAGDAREYVQYVTTNVDALKMSIMYPLHITVTPTGYVCAGDVLTYRVDWANSGDLAASAFTITDTLPAGLEYVGASLVADAYPDAVGVPTVSAQWSTTYEGPWRNGQPDTDTEERPFAVRWTVSRVSPGSSGTLRFRMRVALGPEETGDFINSVRADWLLNLDGPVSSTELVKNSKRVMLLEKSASMFEVYPGETFTYSLKYTSFCNSDLKDVRIWDSLPVNVTFVSATGGGVYDGTKIDWTIPSVPAGTQGTVAFTVYPDDTQDSVVNYGEADYRNLDNEDMPRLRSGDSTVLVTPPKLYFRKFRTPLVAKGGTIHYDIEVFNNAGATITNIVIWDTPPAHTAYSSLTGPGSWTGTMAVWGLAKAVPRTSQVVGMDVTVDNSVCYEVGPNVAWMNFDPISFKGVPAPAIKTDDVYTTVLEPKLAFSERADKAFVPVNDAVTYFFTISCTGTLPAKNVLVTTSIPPQTTFSAASGTYVKTGSLLEWTIGDLSPGMSALVYYTTTVFTADGFFTTTGLAEYEDSIGCTLWAASGVVYTSVAQPSLDIGKEVDLTTVPVGGSVNYTINVYNTGLDSALNVEVVDTLPDGLTITGISPPAATIVTALGTTMIQWSIPRVSVLEQVTMSFSASVTGTEGTIAGNEAVVDYTNRGGLALLPKAAQSYGVHVRQANLQMALYGSLDPAVQDANLTFILTLTNTGGIPARNIRIWDSLPAGALFTGLSGGSSRWFDGDKAVWIIDTLPAGAALTLYLSVTSTADFSCTEFAQADYFNDALVERPRITSNGYCARVVQPVITLSVEPERTESLSGAGLAYTVAFSNTGTGRADKISLWDTLPPGSVFISASDGGALTGSMVYWSLSSLLPGASSTVTFTIIPPPADCASPDPVGAVTRARIDYYNGGFVHQPNVEAVSATVWVENSRLMLVLSTGAPIVRQGDSLTYSIDYSNPCSATAFGATVFDSLPAGTSSPVVSGGSSNGVTGGMAWWVLPDIPPGGNGTLSFTVDVTGPGLSIGPNVAQADYTNELGTARPRETSNAVTVQVVVPRIDLVKTAPAGTWSSGKEITYTLVATNNGTDTALNVCLVDTLPAGLRLVSGDGAAQYGAVLEWCFARLNIGQSVTVHLVARAGDESLEGEVTNVAHTHYRNTKSATVFVGASATARVVFEPAFVFRVYPNPYKPGLAQGGKLKFSGLPDGTVVRLFALTGVRIRTLSGVSRHRLEWDGRNDEGTDVAPGIYLYVVEMPGTGSKKWLRGKIGLVR